MDNYNPHHPSKLPEDLRTYAREMRTHMTDAEVLLWKLLRNRRVADAKFRRQHSIGRYIIDFYCDEKKLAIELDGSQHMDTADYDQQRDAWLKAQGIQVLAETESVMEAIYVAVAPSTALTCSAHVRLQADIVTQAWCMHHETPASPPGPSPARGRGE